MSKCTQMKKKVGQCSFLPSSHSLNEFFMCFFFIISGCSDISSEFWSRNDSRLFVGEVKDGLCCFTLCAVFPTHRLYLGGPPKVHLATHFKNVSWWSFHSVQRLDDKKCLNIYYWFILYSLSLSPWLYPHKINQRVLTQIPNQRKKRKTVDPAAIWQKTDKYPWFIISFWRFFDWKCVSSLWFQYVSEQF